LAPHLGHVSNFCGVRWGLLEPIQHLSFEHHPGGDEDAIRTGRPAWMHLELPVRMHPFTLLKAGGLFRGDRLGVGTVVGVRVQWYCSGREGS